MRCAWTGFLGPVGAWRRRDLRLECPQLWHEGRHQERHGGDDPQRPGMGDRRAIEAQGRPAWRLKLCSEGIAVDYLVPGNAAADAAPGAFRESWAAVWRGMTEIVGPAPSHYVASGGWPRSSHVRLASGLDGVCGIAARASTWEDPAVMHREGISDPAAVEMQLALRSMRPAGERPIPGTSGIAALLQRTWGLCDVGAQGAAQGVTCSAQLCGP